MPDEFEKKIDKHYTYSCGKDISNDPKRPHIGWYIACAEHEPNKKPPFGQRSYNIARGLTEDAAKRRTQELQTEETNRRKKLNNDIPKTPDDSSDNSEFKDTPQDLKNTTSQE